jgi:sugar (pentulose or hexulose) kinase
VASLGTSGTVFTHSQTPILDPEGLIAPFCASVGGWLPLLCVMNLTGVTEEVRASCGRSHAELTEAASRVDAGCDGLLWLPYLAGERVPDLPRATGSLLGMRAGHLRPEVLYRAALEGTSLNLAWGVERMRALGLEVREVNLVGGAARNPLWRSILASCLDAPVQLLVEPESAALGAALQAAWTLRLERGEGAAIHELARPFIVREGEPALPDARWREVYALAGERLQERVRTLYGD